MSKPLVVVTGKNGQLGWELQRLHEQYIQQFDFLFVDREEMDLGNLDSVSAFFHKYQPAYFINCGAYTAVDKAETEQELAYTINAASVGVIASACKAIDATLITISTDYVFNGKGTKPYAVDDATEPVNYYGYTKWLGEKLAKENNPKTIVIRTSWVYSSHGNNFVKTMLRLMKERQELKVVSDQVGAPTYAADLAEAIMQVMLQQEAGNTQYGTYHFSNEGVISWFDFAVAIRDNAQLSCSVLPIPTEAYPTPAKRPAYSVLDKQAIVKDYSVVLKDWKPRLQQCLKELQAI